MPGVMFRLERQLHLPCTCQLEISMPYFRGLPWRNVALGSAGHPNNNLLIVFCWHNLIRVGHTKGALIPLYEEKRGDTQKYTYTQRPLSDNRRRQPDTSSDHNALIPKMSQTKGWRHLAGKYTTEIVPDFVTTRQHWEVGLPWNYTWVHCVHWAYDHLGSIMNQTDCSQEFAQLHYHVFEGRSTVKI